MNVLDAGYAIAAVVAAPWWMRKARGDWRGRFGHAKAMEKPATGRRRILLHAVSVGEVNAIRGLVPELAARGAEVVVSVGTDTGIARARELFESPPAQAGMPPLQARPTQTAGTVATVVRYPLDFSRCVRRFLDAVKPDVVGLVELEVWPNFVRECARRGIPVGVVNGRLSERSFKGYRRFRWFIGPTFRRLAMAGVQDEAYRARFLEMGVPPERCTVTGSMKWDAAAISDSVPGAEELAREMGIDRTKPLVVGGSTGPLARRARQTTSIVFMDHAEPGHAARTVVNEEELLDHACPANASLLCAPRKPERFAEALEGMGGPDRCTQRTARGTNPPDRTRFLLDTIGELRAAYSLADIVVVGRSFGDLYGSDPIEPIALGKATVIGPAVKDFESIVRAFEEAGGIVRTTADDLPRVLRELLEDPSRRRELAERGRACIRANQGATGRHAEILLGLRSGRAADERG